MTNEATSGNPGTQPKKYSEVIKNIKTGARVADIDSWLLEVNDRILKLEESDWINRVLKLEESNKLLKDKLAEKDMEINKLTEELKETGTSIEPINQGKSWSSFLQNGPSKQKSTEQEMISYYTYNDLISCQTISY